MPRLLFALFAMGILGLLYGYVGLRIIGPAPLGPSGRQLAWGILTAMWLVNPLAIWLDRSDGRPDFADSALWLVYLNLGVLAMMFTLLVARDLLWLVARGIDALANLVRGDTVILPADPERRRVLLHGLNVGIVGASGVLGVWGYQEARRTPRVMRVDVPVKGLHPSLDGLKIAQLTDIHVGPTIKQSWLQEVVAEVNRQGADLVAVTGDVVDGLVHDLRDHVAPLGQLKSNYGTFYVTGNHEYYWGGPAWVEEFTRLGLKALGNQHEVIEHGGARLMVAGVTDYSAGRMIPGHESDPHKAGAGAGEVDFRLLLAHQPRSIFTAAEAGFDLQLSGHTHGGQIFPWNFMVPLQQPFVNGLHTFQKMQIYVSRGTGYWGPPIRVGAPSEISLLTLRAV